MTYLSIITAAAKAAKVSAILLYAICAHESNDFSLDYSMYDNGSPSYGVCQIKYETSLTLGFHGKPMELRNPHIGTKYAALYLKYQLNRYNGNICKSVAAYNAGSYIESTKMTNHPKNLRYVKSVQKRLDKRLRPMLDCGSNTKINEYFIDRMEMDYEDSEAN